MTLQEEDRNALITYRIQQASECVDEERCLDYARRPVTEQSRGEDNQRKARPPHKNKG